MAVTISTYNHTTKRFLEGSNAVGDTYKVKLLTAATFDATHTTLAATGGTEVTNANGYTTGGLALTNVAVANGSTAFTDASSGAKTVTVYGNAQISTAQSKFGGASAYFDGTGDYLQLAHSNDFNFGSGDFTVEFWLKTDQTTQGTCVSHRSVGGGASNTNWLIHINFPTVNKIGLYLSDGSIYQVSGLTTATSVNDNQWRHICVSRSGSTIRLFVDVTVENSATWSGAIASTSRVLQIGNDSVGAFLNGYIDELRITKGVARYTANFTPPAAPFPTA